MPNNKAKTILLIEDDNFLANLLSSRLSKEGFGLMAAKDGQEALDMLSKSRPDLVLMDLILPEKSGFEVMELIASDPRYGKPPVMIISNLGQDSDMQRGRKLGAVEYFVKANTSIDAMLERIKNYLSTH